jgi:hypothetical protein
MLQNYEKSGEEKHMRKLGIAVVMLVVLWSVSAVAQDQGKRTIASEMQQRLAGLQRQVVSIADAMPESKFSFAPSEGEFKGVRNYGAQVKHIASISYLVCSAISGEKAPEGLAGEDGPASITSKSQAISYLKDAFEYCNKAYGTVEANNALEPVKGPFGMSTRLGLMSTNNTHVMDHYGQMVVYLRMNGIVPPASRPKQ